MPLSRMPPAIAVVDFKKHNLHVVSYAVPVRAKMTPRPSCEPHLHSMPGKPDWIPYRTSYYRESWGFCVSQRQREALRRRALRGGDRFAICKPWRPYLWRGAAEAGDVEEEVLIYTHICHPSLCNDNLSAIAVACLLAQKLEARPRRFSYRFIFGPATMGSITWLAQNETHLPNTCHGLVLASLGERGGLTYKKSQRVDADIDRILGFLAGTRACRRDRGFLALAMTLPGFNLPVGQLTRTPNACYAEYHTSADSLDFVTPATLADSLNARETLIAIIEQNARYINLSPKCEPRLAPRGLLRNSGGCNPAEFELAILSVLNGTPDLLSIAEKSRLSFALIADAAKALWMPDCGRAYSPGKQLL